MRDEVVVLHHTRLIDGIGGPLLNDAGVVIDGSILAWVGPVAELPDRYASAARVDLGGRTVCPGFIDAHVHFALPGQAQSILANAVQTPSYRVLNTLKRLRLTLHNGVTTARDLLGLDAGFRQAVAERKIVGPRLLVSIAMLSQRAGHADFTISGGIDAFALAVAQPGAPGNLVNTVDELRTRVRELIAAGPRRPWPAFAFTASSIQPPARGVHQRSTSGQAKPYIAVVPRTVD